MKNSDHTILKKLRLFWRPEEAPRCAVADAFSILSAFRETGVDRAMFPPTVVRTICRADPT